MSPNETRWTELCEWAAARGIDAATLRRWSKEVNPFWQEWNCGPDWADFLRRKVDIAVAERDI